MYSCYLDFLLSLELCFWAFRKLSWFIAILWLPCKQIDLKGWRLEKVELLAALPALVSARVLYFCEMPALH